MGFSAIFIQLLSHALSRWSKAICSSLSLRTSACMTTDLYQLQLLFVHFLVSSTANIVQQSSTPDSSGDLCGTALASPHERIVLL